MKNEGRKLKINTNISTNINTNTNISTKNRNTL